METQRKLLLSGVFMLAAILMSLPSHATGQSIQISMKNVPLKEVFKEIRRQTGYTFTYNEQVVSQVGARNVEIASDRIEDIMKECLEGTSLGFVIQDDVVVISTSNNAQRVQAPNTVVTGRVVNKAGSALAGVTVSIPGTTTGVATDPMGNFSLDLQDRRNVVLEFSYVGMQRQRVTVADPANARPLHVVMEEETLKVDQVVVVGYGTTAVRDMTGQVVSITEEQIEKMNVTNVENLMQNMAAGVVVSTVTSSPREKIRVRVRGETSVTGDNEPLYVLDGIPVTWEAINAVAPQDIQSMDILKDASAAAIYGSRGANGVVIMTTKKGNANMKPTLNVSYTFNTDSRIENYKMLDGDEFREFVRRTAQYTIHPDVDPSNTTAKNILAENSTVLKNGNTDWFRKMKRSGGRHDVSLSVRGGGEKSNYFVSFGLLDYKGMIEHDDYSRYTGRINADYFLTSFITFGTNTSIGYTDISKPGSSLFSAIGTRPDFPVYNEDGSYFKDGTRNTPVVDNLKENYTHNFSILSNNYIELKIWKELKFRSSLAINQAMTFNEYFNPSITTTNGIATGGESTSRSFSTTFDHMLSYKGHIAPDHYLDAVAGMSFERAKYRGFGLGVRNYPLDERLTGITNASELTSKSGSGSTYGLQSTLARINYIFKDRYLFTFTARYDGSSDFGKNNRFGFFPSGAIAWRIGDEPFMQDIRWINDLKIKASVGRTGIQNFSRGSYANIDLYSTTQYMDIPGIMHSTLGNKDIKWETTVQYDLGVDFVLFDYVLSGSLGIYRKNTEDLVWDWVPPYSLGFSTNGSQISTNKIPRNIATVRNQGIELSLRANIFRAHPDWDWSLGLNLARNRNKVTELVEIGAIANAEGTIIHATQSNQGLALGHPMGVYIGYGVDGIIQDKDTVDRLNEQAKAHGATYYDGSGLRMGHMLIRDADGNGFVNTSDRIIIGSPQPDLIGGLTSDVRWKQLSLYTHFGFQIGGKKLYNKSMQNLPTQLTGLVNYNLYNRWTPDNTSAKLPAMYIGDMVYKTTKFDIHDTTNLRLQELRISYELPEILGRKYVKYGEVFFSATNLFIITNYPGPDPSTVGAVSGSYSSYGGNYESWGYPALRTFSFGLRLSF